MQRVLACLAVVLAMSVGAAPSSRAADGDGTPLPAVHALGCTAGCADIVEPVPDKKYGADLRGLLGSLNYNVDGLVELQYIVKADGHIGDIMVTRLIGPQKYADIAKDRMKDAVFKPATLNGMAIDRDFTSVMDFNHNGTSFQTRDANQAVINNARRLVNDNALDEAEAKLVEAPGKTDLLFYEWAGFANMRAAIALKQGNFVKARRLMEAPLFFARMEGGHGDTVNSLVHTRLLADINLGDAQDAQAMLANLKRIGFFDESDPMVKAVDTLKAKIDAAPAFTIDADIPPAGEGDAYVFGLYRRTFAVRNVASGALDKMIIRCKQRSAESDVTPAAEWHVPNNWGDCQVTLHGTPGTKFQLLQFAN